MSDFKPNKVSLRFVESYNSLKELRAFRSDAEFARSIDYSPQTINAILLGKRDVNIEILIRFFNAYKVRPSFIFDVPEPEKSILKSENEESKSVGGIQVLAYYLDEVKPILLRLNRIQEAIMKFKIKDAERFLPEEWKIAHATFDAFEKRMFDLLKVGSVNNNEYKEAIEQLQKFHEVFSQEFILFSYLLAELVIDPNFKINQAKDNAFQVQKTNLKGREILVKSKVKQRP